jgi:hypothetical protein
VAGGTGPVIGRVESILSSAFGALGRTHSRRHWPDAGSHSRQRLCPGACPCFGSGNIPRSCEQYACQRAQSDLSTVLMAIFWQATCILCEPENENQMFVSPNAARERLRPTDGTGTWFSCAPPSGRKRITSPMATVFTIETTIRITCRRRDGLREGT